MATWKHVSTYLTRELGAQPLDKSRLAIELPASGEGLEPISLVALHATSQDPTAEQVILRLVVAPLEDLDLPRALEVAGTASRGGLVASGGMALLTHSFLLSPLSAAEAQGTAAVSIAHLAGVVQQVRAG